MNRTRALPPLWLAIWFTLACGAPPPDVVVITLDTTRADALGVYGQTDPTSPRIDAMAADGLVFDQVVTSAPSTFPAHATLFTGKQPYAHGVRSNTGYQLADENVTLAEVFEEHGWATGAEVAARVIARDTHLDQGFDVYRDPRAVADAVMVMQLEGSIANATRSAEDITEHGLAFIRENAERPFFLWLHYFDPHQPRDPPERFGRGLPAYYGEIRRVDYHVGLVLDELERLGLRKRTIVVLTADHGEGLGQHGEQTHSFFVYDSTMRVPLIFWGADVIPRGRRAPGLARVVDVAPTLLDLAGLPAPAGMQGVSLRPVFEHPSLDLGLMGYGESIEPMLAFGSSVLRFVRVGHWKYVHKLEPELYDLASDPREVRNLADREPEKVAELRGRLEELVDAAPPKPRDSSVEIDAQHIAALQALGYVASNAPEGLDDERAALAVHGPDPSTRIAMVELISKSWGLIREGKYDLVVDVMTKLSRENPDSPAILLALSEALNRAGRVEELLPVLRRGLELEPRSQRYHLLLAQHLMETDPEEAERLLREALQLDPCSRNARIRLALVLHRGERYAEQLALLEEKPDGCPEDVSMTNALAWLLATAPDDGLRDGERALRLAQQAVAATDGGNPDYLDTLAAAWAERGDFERALTEQRKALALLEHHDLPPETVDLFRGHLATLEAGEPIRDSGAP